MIVVFDNCEEYSGRNIHFVRVDDFTADMEQGMLAKAKAPPSHAHGAKVLCVITECAWRDPDATESFDEFMGAEYV